MRRTIFALGLAIAAFTPGGPQAATLADWPAYLFSPRHNSVTPSDTITPANAATLHRVWRFKPPPSTLPGQPAPMAFASPTVVGNRVYMGFNNGVFYALDLATGRVVWQRFLGFDPQKTCAGYGIVSTATVSVNSATGIRTVYVNGGDGFLYALNAATGATIWRSLVARNSDTVSGYYNWTSPAVANGKIYVGLSSNCDRPFTRGGIKAFDQTTGALVATHWTMPKGQVGGGVWSSIGVAPNGEIYATTGSTDPPPAPQGQSYSMLQLDGETLAQHGIWTVPDSDLGGDSDFGASPSFFTAKINNVDTLLVSACNKNGVLYAWRAKNVSAGPVWRAKINTALVNPCYGGTIFDGAALYQVGSRTKIDGVRHNGSINKIDPATGAFVWRTPIPGRVFGSASLNGAGVLAVSTFDNGTENGTYLVRADTGAILSVIRNNNAKQFAQPVFASKYLLVAPVSQGLNVYSP